MTYLLGIDIGGTKIELVALKNNFQKKPQKLSIAFQARIPTERERGYSHILKQVEILYRECLLHLKITPSKIASIGLSLPGSVDPKTHNMILGNTFALKNKPLIKDLQKRLRIKSIFTENDANCFALAECYFGAGAAYFKKTRIPPAQQNCVGFILGTGMGSGLILEGQIHSGRRGSAGEIGHIPINKSSSQKCYCGQKDCAELFLSGEGLKAHYLSSTSQTARATDILNIPQWAKDYRKTLARVIGQIINTLDPDYVVLGGGVSRHPQIYKGLQKEIAPFLFIKKTPPPVLKHQISDSAGSIGAALLAVFPKKL